MLTVVELHDAGLSVLRKLVKDNPVWKDLNLEDFVTTGFNYPVSVPQLHLHMVSEAAMIL